VFFLARKLAQFCFSCPSNLPQDKQLFRRIRSIFYEIPTPFPPPPPPISPPLRPSYPLALSGQPAAHTLYILGLRLLPRAKSRLFSPSAWFKLSWPVTVSIVYPTGFFRSSFVTSVPLPFPMRDYEIGTTRTLFLLLFSFSMKHPSLL